MNTERIRLYAIKTAERKRLDAEVNALKAELADLEKELLEEFAEAGVVRETVSTPYGNYNVGPKSQIWASAPDGAGDEGKDYAKSCTALRAVGWGDFIQERFNSMILSAHIRELVKMGLATIAVQEDGREVLKTNVPGQDLSALEEGLKISTVFKIGVTKAAGK